MKSAKHLHVVTDDEPRRGRPRKQGDCTAPNCDRRAYARNLCRGHYSRLQKTGSIRGDQPIRFKRENEFFEYSVILQTGCWEWSGYRDKHGYGYLGHKRAHRIAYERFKGPIQKGKIICHTCDNPPCVNPDHLWLGTHKDNSRDMAAKLRAKNQHGPQRLARA